MKIPTWLEEDAVLFEAPAIAEAINEASVAVAMGGLLETEKLPMAFASIVDPQDTANVVHAVAVALLGALCDKAGFSAGTKAKLVAEVRDRPAVIPVKKATEV